MEQGKLALISLEEKNSVLSQLNKSLVIKLHSLPTYGKINLEDSIWNFIDLKGNIIAINFLFLSSEIFSAWQKNIISFQNENISLTLTQYVKLIFLHFIKSSQNVTNYRYRLDVIKLMFLFLVQKKCRVFDKEKLKEFYTVLLTNDIKNDEFVKRISPPSFKQRFVNFQEDRLLSIINRFKGTILIDNKLLNYTSKIKNEVCIDTLDMTLKDYMDGESFNYLGLEIGKHYVDHCANIFQDHGLYGSVCRFILKTLHEEPSGKSKAARIAVASNFLMGIDVEHSITVYKFKQEKAKILIEWIKNIFVDEYNAKSPIFRISDTSVINKIISHLGIPYRFDNQEFIRGLIFTLQDNKAIKSFDGQLEEYRALLTTENINFDQSNKEVKEIIDEELKKYEIKSNNVCDICNYHGKLLLNLSKDTSKKGAELFKAILALTEAAGTTLFVALTGWRASEFGFPLININISSNPDPLDNSYIAHRFHVKWVTPKTAGNTKLNREISLSAYLIAKKLHYLNVAKKDDPCLYKADPTMKHKYISSKKIYLSVTRAWFQFPFQYKVFKYLDDTDLNSDLEMLSEGEIDTLKEMRNKLKDDVEVFGLIKNRSEKLKSIGQKFIAFQNGTLNKFESKIIEKSLSKTTLKELMAEKNLSLSTVAYFVNELLADSVYPTPHAFRHMWAEAVLLRYRGDVGKFIRANFKHLNEGFFIAYLRNKETKIVMRIAKRKIISNIVREQMNTSRSSRGGYAGGFERFISKVTFITKVLSPEEFSNKAQEIADTRIIDIKSSSWGTCMLRTGTLHSAKCSENGIPNRHLASPKLCLGCTNANVAEGNFNGIVLYIKGDIDACREKRLPYFVKKAPLKTLRLALKRVIELNQKAPNPKYSDFISYLKESIKMTNQPDELEISNE
jgi:hypothetical protein